MSLQKATAEDAYSAALLHKKVYPKYLLTSNLPIKVLQSYYGVLFKELDNCYLVKIDSKVMCIALFGQLDPAVQKKFFKSNWLIITYALLSNPKIATRVIYYRLFKKSFNSKYNYRMFNLLKGFSRELNLNNIQIELEKKLIENGIKVYGHSVDQRNTSAINYHIKNKCNVEAIVGGRVFMYKKLI